MVSLLIKGLEKDSIVVITLRTIGAITSVIDIGT
jgi:hypothetical protein